MKTCKGSVRFITAGLNQTERVIKDFLGNIPQFLYINSHAHVPKNPCALMTLSGAIYR